MDINWGQVWPWLAGAGLWLWKHGRAVVAETTSYVQKYYGDGHLSDRELEEIAVDLAKRRLPGVPAWLIRQAVRRVCAWRKKSRLKVMGEGSLRQ